MGWQAGTWNSGRVQPLLPPLSRLLRPGLEHTRRHPVKSWEHTNRHFCKVTKIFSRVLVVQKKYNNKKQQIQNNHKGPLDAKQEKVRDITLETSSLWSAICTGSISMSNTVSVYLSECGFYVESAHG